MTTSRSFTSVVPRRRASFLPPDGRARVVPIGGHSTQPPAAAQASRPDLQFVAQDVRPFLADTIEAEKQTWTDIGAPWHGVLEAFEDFIDGGKWLRPRFCYWGFESVGGRSSTSDLVRACAALELLHAFALIHDDIMDQSDSRRGRPSLHRHFEGEHRDADWSGSAQQHGSATALLAGDVAFALACRLAAELPSGVRSLWGRLVSELLAGQYLDLVGTARQERSAHLARTISRLKSGRYTVAGPLLLGAALAGVAPDPALEPFGELIGESFQLRDDLLGVFGDSTTTGKPVGDDIRSGKPTVVLATAEWLMPAGDVELLARLGQPDLTEGEITEITAAIDRCGARAQVESRIQANVRRALVLLESADLTATVRNALAGLAVAASNREL
ncbi:MAG: polyprenyl synthetase family protein [Candidatus Nanopelagicales bacterium]